MATKAVLLGCSSQPRNIYPGPGAQMPQSAFSLINLGRLAIGCLAQQFSARLDLRRRNEALFESDLLKTGDLQALPRPKRLPKGDLEGERRRAPHEAWFCPIQRRSFTLSLDK